MYPEEGEPRYYSEPLSYILGDICEFYGAKFGATNSIKRFGYTRTSPFNKLYLRAYLIDHHTVFILFNNNLLKNIYVLINVYLLDQHQKSKPHNNNPKSL